MASTCIHADGLIFGLQRHGGVHRATKNLLSELARRSDVHLCTHLPSKVISDMSWLAPRCIRSIAAPARLRPGRVFGKLNARLYTRSVAAQWGKLGHGVFLATYYSTYAQLRIPQVTVIHDMIFERFPDVTLGEWQQRHKAEKLRAIAAAQVIVCPSESARRDVEELCDVRGKQLHVIPWGVEDEYHPIPDSGDVEAFVERATGGARYFLYVGGRDGTKNFVPLLMAFSRWSGRADIHLLAVGGGALTNQENSLLRALQLRDLVHCIPSLSNGELIYAYNGAAGCVMPSLYEGFGFPVLEAMACGTPVAAANVSSLPEVAGGSAILFDPTDNDAIVSALEGLASMARSDERIELGLTRARSLTWTGVADQFVELVSTLS